jgi:hypothetical protein
LAKKLNIQINDSPKLSLPGKLVVPSYEKSGNFSILGLGDIVVPGLLLCFVLRFDAYKRNRLLQMMTSTDSSSSSSSSHVEKTRRDHLKSEQPHRIDCKCSECQLNRSSKWDANIEHEDKIKASFFACRFLSTKSTNSRPTKTLNEKKINYSVGKLIQLKQISYFQLSLLGYFAGLITATLSSEIFSEAQPALLFLVPFTLLPLIIVAYMKGDLQMMWNEPFNDQTTTTTKKAYFYV